MGSWWAFLRARYTAVVLLAIMAVQSGLLVWSCKIHSPTWDEPGYVVAGLSHWKFGRFDLYSVNPPLVRIVATAPVYFFMNPKIDWSLYSKDPAVRSEVELGRAFMEDNGLFALDCMFVARLMLVPVALLGTLLCFLVARVLFGSVSAGLCAALFWAFSPDVLGFGSVMSPDLATAVAGLGCSYLLYQYILKPSFSRAFVLGVATGIAMLCKSVWLLLPAVYALVILIVLAVKFLQRKNYWTAGFDLKSEKDSSPLKVGLAFLHGSLLMVVALFLVNATYRFEGTGASIGSHRFVSRYGVGVSVADAYADLSTQYRRAALKKLEGNRALSQGACPCCRKELRASVSNVASDSNVDAVIQCTSGKCMAELEEEVGMDIWIADPPPGNRFANSLVGAVPVPLPARYIEGMDIQRRDFESGLLRPHWGSYLAGSWKRGGWWYFYAVGYFLKTPMAILVLCLVSSVLFIRWKPSNEQRVLLLATFVPALSMFVLASVNTGLNRHLRYAIPILPAILLWASGAIGMFSSNRFKGQIAQLGYGGKLLAGFNALLVVCFVGTSLWVGPHWLSFFNSFAGGPQNGQKWLSDSCVDWGQDLLLVKEWLEKHSEVGSKVNLAYFGAYSPACIGINYRVPAFYDSASSSRSSLEQSLSGPLPGWYIISKNFAIGHPMPIPSPDGSLQFATAKSFRYFKEFTPVEEIGHSTLVYHLKESEVNAVREKLGLNPMYSEEQSIATHREHR